MEDLMLDKQERSRKRLLLLVVLIGTGLYFFSNLQRTAVPASLFNLLQGTFDPALSAKEVTGMGAYFFYAYAVTQFLVGLLISRFGWVPVIRYGVLLFSAGALIFPAFLGKSIQMLYLSRVLMGFGAGTLYLGVVQALAETFDKKWLSMAVGIFLSCGSAAVVVANAPLLLAVKNFGLKDVFFFIGIVITLLWLGFVVCSFWVKPQAGAPERKWDWTGIKKILTTPNNWYLFLFNWCKFGIFYLVQTIVGQKYAMDFFRLPENRTAWIFSILAVMHAISSITLATLSSLCGNRRALFCRIASTVCFITVAAQVLACYYNWKFWPLILLFGFPAIVSNSASLVVPMFRETNPPEHLSLVTGIGNAGCYLVMAVFGTLSGIILGQGKPLAEGSKVMIYSSKSWMILFGMLTFVAIFGLYGAFRAKDKVAEN